MNHNIIKAALIQAHISLFATYNHAAATPWTSLKNTVRNGILSFVGDFLVPIIGVVLVIMGFVQIPGIVSEYRQGDGNQFWKKVMICAACLIFGLAMGAMWLTMKGQISNV